MPTFKEFWNGAFHSQSEVNPAQSIVVFAIAAFTCAVVIVTFWLVGKYEARKKRKEAGDGPTH